jgi:hypothetical protein
MNKLFIYVIDGEPSNKIEVILNKDTPMAKLVNLICLRQGYNPHEVIFKYKNSVMIDACDTYESLGMKNGDHIEILKK